MREYAVYFTDGTAGPVILAWTATRAFIQAEAIFGRYVSHLEEVVGYGE